MTENYPSADELFSEVKALWAQVAAEPEATKRLVLLGKVSFLQAKLAVALAPNLASAGLATIGTGQAMNAAYVMTLTPERREQYYEMAERFCAGVQQAVEESGEEASEESCSGAASGLLN